MLEQLPVSSPEGNVRFEVEEGAFPPVKNELHFPGKI